jgi:hypothetical protein
MIFLRYFFFDMFRLTRADTTLFLPLTTDRKVQTIKDLERPWAALTPQPPASPSASSPQTWTGHSAATTILLDDSHTKAARQPYNHLCVPEYTRALRSVDLVALQHEQDAAGAEAEAAATAAAAHEDAEDAEELTTPDALSSSSSPSPSAPEKRQKRKRKKEKQLVVQAASSPVPDHVDADAASTTFDETLLAVIGILHAARLQSSIAGWIRAGPLLSERGEVWCDDPASMHAWALRGREAMHELQLDVEHGVIPDP